MSIVAEQTILEKFLTTNGPQIDVAKENVSFDPTGLEEYIRYTVIPDAPQTVYLGDPSIYRSHGIIVAQVFTKAGTGSGSAKGYADYIFNLLQYLDIERIRCLMPSIDTIGERDGWYQVNISTKYYREE